MSIDQYVDSVLQAIVQGAKMAGAERPRGVQFTVHLDSGGDVAAAQSRAIAVVDFMVGSVSWPNVQDQTTARK
jgi:hypothetical protein